MASPAPSQLGSTKSIRSASVQSLANSPRSGPARKLLNALNTVGKEEDQIGESKRVLGVLLGTDSEIGLLALVEQEFLGLLHGMLVELFLKLWRNY